MEPFPSQCSSSFRLAKRVSAERAAAPQIPSLSVYVPEPSSSARRPAAAAAAAVVRNDESHIFLRSRYKKLFEDLEKTRNKRATPLGKRVTISEQLSNSSKKNGVRSASASASASAPPPESKRAKLEDDDDEWK